MPTYEADQPLVTCSVVRTAVKLKYGFVPKKSFTSEACKATIDALHGTIAEGYQKLHAYLERLRNANPGSYAKFETTPTGTFRRCIFVPGCFSNCVDMCKKLVTLDGCHLKGIYSKSGVFLAASMKDGANKNLLVALAIVPTEDEDEWVWFLQQLKLSNLGIPPRFLFISDRCKGLINAVKLEYPQSWHRFCMYHVFNNIRSKKIPVSDMDRNTIYSIADARSHDAFTVSMHTLKTNLPRAYDYLSAIRPGFECWVQYKINDLGFATFGTKTSNSSEENNSWLGVLLRSSDPVSAYYQYMCKLLHKFDKQRSALTNKKANVLNDAVRAQVERYINFSKEYHAIAKCGDPGDVQNIGKYKVRHASVSHVSSRKVHDVDIPARSCSCGRWQDHLLPCYHALAVTKELPFPIMYLNGALQELYRRHVDPASTSDLDVQSTVNPPSVLTSAGKKKPGPPKMKRFKSHGLF